MIQEMIMRGMFVAAVILLAVIVHELGHMLAIHNFKDRWVKMRWIPRRGDIVCVDTETLDSLTDEEFKKVLLGGIIPGVIPLVIFMQGMTFFEGLFAGVIYLWGCKFDIKQLIRIEKNAK